MQRSTPTIPIEFFSPLIIILAIGLIVFAVATAAVVFVSSGKLRFSWGAVWPLIVSLLWIVPAVAVLGVVTIRSARHFRSAIPPTPTVTNVANKPATEVLVPSIMQTVPPAWADSTVSGPGGTQVVLSSERWATMEEAEQQVTEAVVQRATAYFHQEHPQWGNWSIPLTALEQAAVRQIVGESIDKDFGNGFKQKMYRVHVLLELTPEVRQRLYGSWSEQIVNRRLQILGCLLGLVTLMLATAAGYFRLDDLSLGRFRGRLRLAAVSLVTAGTLIVVQLVS